MYSRNDDHGGDMQRRMKTMLFGLIEQAERYSLDSEIVLIDWNPPANRPLLKDAYHWPRHTKYCSVRSIVVPISIHQRYKDWEKIPIHGSVAKNLAFRRARGEFILTTNVDILFSEALARFLALKNLGDNTLYLINRTDVKRGVTRLNSLDEQLIYCQKNILRVNRYSSEKSSLNSEGLPDFWNGGAGDFTLMSRKCWHRLRGYPETEDILGLRLDGVLCYMAYAAGMETKILKEPMYLYHLEHDMRCYSREANWLTRTGLRSVLPERLLAKVRPWVRRFIPAKIEASEVSMMTCSELAGLVSDMVHGRRSYIYNDETWGLGNENFQEFEIVKKQRVT